MNPVKYPAAIACLAICLVAAACSTSSEVEGPATNTTDTGQDAAAQDAVQQDDVQQDAGESGADTASTKDDKFSFFVTSIETMRKLSGSQQGFGGDLGGALRVDLGDMQVTRPGAPSSA